MPKKNWLEEVTGEKTRIRRVKKGNKRATVTSSVPTSKDPHRIKLNPQRIRAIQQGLIQVPKPKKKAYVRRVDEYKVQERLVFIATMLKNNTPILEVYQQVMKKYKIRKAQAAKYIRVCFDELSNIYGEDQRNQVYHAWLQAIQYGMAKAMDEDLQSFEKIARLFGEAMHFVIPKQLQKSTEALNSVQIGNINVANLPAEKVLSAQNMESMTLESFFSNIGLSGFSESGTEAGSKEEARLLDARATPVNGSSEAESSSS